MKKRYLSMFLLTLSLGSGLRADESLFSEVAMESVFEKKVSLTNQVASLNESGTFERITGTATLVAALKSAGFSPTEDKDQVRIEVAYERWKFPVTMRVELEKDRLLCEFSLAELADVSKVDSDRLLKLLSQNDPSSGACFAYDASAKSILLRSAFDNRSLTAEKLRLNLMDRAKFADANSVLWSDLKANDAKDTKAPTGTNTASNTTANKNTATPSNALPATLVGSWAGSLQGGSIAIKLMSNSQFQLVTIQSGKTSMSQGKTVVSGDKLTLQGNDGVTLNCSFVQTKSNNFRLSLLDASGRAKTTIDFTKANP